MKVIDPFARDHHDDSNNKGQSEPALKHDVEVMELGASGGRKNSSNEHQGPTIQKSKLNESIPQKKIIGEQGIVSAFDHSPTSLPHSSYSKDLRLHESVSTISHIP